MSHITHKEKTIMSDNKVNKNAVETNTNSKLMSFSEQLAHDRAEWNQRLRNLEKQKTDIGYKDKSFESLSEKSFISSIISDDHSKAETILLISNTYKSLINEKKTLWPEKYAVDEMNKNHAVILTTQAYIISELKDKDGNDNFILHSTQSLRLMMQNKRIICSDGKDRSMVDIWVKSPERRDLTGFTFDTSTTEHTGGKYNMWKGFSVKPKKGNAEIFWNHVRENICDGKEDIYIYVRKWIAAVFQKPTELHTSLVLCGSQGVGKNIFAESLGYLLGQHFSSINNMETLFSRFNSSSKYAVLTHVDEAMWGGYKSNAGQLKSKIAGEYACIEEKGKDVIQMRNTNHYIFSSNEDFPISIDADDRRFVVLNVSDNRKEDHQYFGELVSQLKYGGYAALLHDILNEDIDGFNLRKLPNSDSSLRIKLKTGGSAAKYIHDALSQSSFDTLAVGLRQWDDQLTKQELFDMYLDWCKSENEKNTLERSRFGNAMNKYLPVINDSQPRINGKRIRMHIIPSLIECKKSFCESFKVSMEYAFSEKGE